MRGAIPHAYFDPSYTISTAEVAVHVLDFLYIKLDQVCLVQGGEVCCLSHSVFMFFFTSFLISSQAGVLILSGSQVEGFHMLLQIFAGTLLPYIEGLDSWLFEGTLDDPFGEVPVLAIVSIFYGSS